MSAGPSRARVTARLAQLQDAYDGFDVHQTTVSVAPSAFERAVEGSDVVAQAAVRVQDDDGRFLVVPDGDDWVDPSGPVSTGQSIVDTAVDLVERQTGIVPYVDGLERVSIVCLNCDEPADEPLYQLYALFHARPVEGSDVVAQAAVRVQDDDGRYLVVPDGDDWVDPSGPVSTGQSIVDTAVELVERQTGIVPYVDGLERVSIVCLNCDEPADEPLYQLYALFHARPVEGTVTGDAAWREEPPVERV